MPTMHARGFALRDADTAADGPIPFVFATEGRKADGLDLSMANVDLGRYTANPVVMYGHDYWGREGLPIGRAEDVRVDGGRLLGSLDFDLDDEFAAKVDRKVRKGYLNAVSVGFDAMDIDDAGVPGTWVLYEVSVVPLPMDPDAVADDGRALALARALGGLDLARAGKVLSKANLSLVEDAHSALGRLIDSARKDEATADDTGDDGDGDEADDEGRGAQDMAMRQRRLRWALATAPAA